MFSTHIAHRGTGRRSHLSSLRHINHRRGRLGASCALVSRGSRYISLQVKCNQSVYRANVSARARARVHVHAHTQRSANYTIGRFSVGLCRTGTANSAVGTIRDWQSLLSRKLSSTVPRVARETYRRVCPYRYLCLLAVRYCPISPVPPAVGKIAAWERERGGKKKENVTQRFRWVRRIALAGGQQAGAG